MLKANKEGVCFEGLDYLALKNKAPIEKYKKSCCAKIKNRLVYFRISIVCMTLSMCMMHKSERAV